MILGNSVGNPREGLRIIKDEVIFISDLGEKKYLFVQMI